MTWIKPSFLWMMYRSGWAAKPGQEHVLAVEISRSGFEWALSHACLSQFAPKEHPDRTVWQEQLKTSPVRVQWDPERTLRLAQLPHRSLQVGLSGEAVHRYTEEWTVGITDVTAVAHRMRGLLAAGDTESATELLPAEHPYPLAPEIAEAIGADGHYTQSTQIS